MSTFSISALQSSFKQPAIKASFENMHHCLGLLTAVASSPEKIQPAEWIEQIKRHPERPTEFENDEQLRQFTRSLGSWWHYCMTHFDKGDQLELPGSLGLTPTGKPNKALVDFSTGYLKGYNWLSKTWQTMLPKDNHEAARSLMVLNLILARFIDEKAAAKTEPEIFEQLPEISGCFKTLPNLLSAVGMLGIDLASDSQAEKQNPPLSAPVVNLLKDIGRNDPCPCGSGKKFKKCCLH